MVEAKVGEGHLVLLWHQNVQEKTIDTFGHFIHMEIQAKTIKSLWSATFIYGSPYQHSKRFLWSTLHNIT